MFGDLNGDRKWDMLGWDIDGGAAGRYANVTPDNSFEPVYAP